MYEGFKKNYDGLKQRENRPLTLTEKSYCSTQSKYTKVPTGMPMWTFPDRVAMQDATAQMAIYNSCKPEKEGGGAINGPLRSFNQAKVGAEEDLLTAIDTNKEVYDFLASASNKYGIGFWKPGAGIIHQVVLENYAFLVE